MKNSEYGFTYPLTLSLLIVFLVFFSMQVEQLLTERKMAHETSVILQQEYYFLSSVRKLETLLQTGGTIPAKGTIPFQNGNMEYSADPPVGTTQKVNFTLKLNSCGPVIGRGFFDTSTKRLVKWAELK